MLSSCVCSYVCAENRRLNAIQDPDYTLIVRVEDLGGGVPRALSSITRVNVAVIQNLWVNPRPVVIMENFIAKYPKMLTSVRLGLSKNIHHKMKCNFDVLSLLSGL